MTARPLRLHQTTGLDRLREALRSGSSAVMFQAPTGFGKTRVMAEIVIRALTRGKAILIVVPALSLVDQTVEALEAEGVEKIGVIQANHERTDGAAPVQVASVQTLQRRALPACDIILIDEAHRWFRYFTGLLTDAKARKVPVIGLSATPWTKGLGRHFDDLVQVTTTAELVRLGFLSPFRVYAPSRPDLCGVRTLAGDYHEKDLGKVMNTPALVAGVVSSWLKRGEQRPTLCFAVDRAHAKELQEKFEAAGVGTGYIDANTSREERAEIRWRFHAGEIKIICNVGCLSTGIDMDVRCIILARPTKSEILFTQIIGRGLRTAPGKADCLILDHSDTHRRLGFVTDIRHDKLDDGEGKRCADRQDVPKPTACPSCGFLRPAEGYPDCGYPFSRRTNVPRSRNSASSIS